jgi:CHRD domain
MRSGYSHGPCAGDYSRCALATLVFAIGLAVPASSFASTVAFRADLKGANMVPPTASSASGYVRATYDTTSRKLSWTGSQSGLSSKITHIDFHGPAGPAEAAGVVQSISNLSEGSATLSDAEAADLIGGHWSLIIHTRSHPDGEIRGQVYRGE